MIAFLLVGCLLAVPALSLPAPAGGVGGVVGDMVEIIMMKSQILSIFNMEFMMTSITQTLVKKDMVMRLVISRESTTSTFLMEEYSMLSTMLMETMVAPSWRSNMMGKLTTLSSMDMLGMVDMCRFHSIFIIYKKELHHFIL